MPRTPDPGALQYDLRADHVTRADNPQAGHSCQRSASVLGTAAPHTHTWLVPRGSTFTSSRPALAALYQSLAKKEFHPASWTGPANIPRESPLMFKSSTAINP